jgi:hypothetical protein
MTIKQFLSIIGFATLLCWSALGFVLWNIDPTEASILHMGFFYLSLFLALAGSVATVLYGWYHFFGDVQIPVFRYVKKSISRGVLVAGSITIFLFLQAMNVLNAWTLTLIVLIIAFFVSLKFSQRKTRSV